MCSTFRLHMSRAHSRHTNVLLQGVIVSRESQLGPPVAAQRRDRRTSRAQTEHNVRVRPTVNAELSKQEKTVLDCLRAEANGLTLRQLEARTACSAHILEHALDELVRQDLVSRLNTLVPSYICKRPGIRACAE